MESLQTTTGIYDQHQWFTLSSTSRLLFYELVMVNASQGWNSEFTCSNQYLCRCMGVHEKTLIRSRNALIRIGLIGFTSNAANRQAGIYSFGKPADENAPETTGISTGKMPANIYLYIYNIIYNNNLEKESKKKENIKIEEEKALFEKFRNLYPGPRRTLQTEFDYFRRTHADYAQVLPLLLPALEKLVKWTKKRFNNGGFVPDYPRLHTWILERRWETELPKDTNYYD